MKRRLDGEMPPVSFKTFAPDELVGPLNDVERKNAPEKLFVCGDIDLLRTTARVSIIGTRRPSTEGLKRAESLAKILVEKHITVVSGLAMGIDTQAHKTAIRNKGRTIAVLGTALDKTYPAQNAGLQQEIMRDHLAVSQFPIGYPTRPSCFPMRNRTMALVSHATVIVEAAEGSGTLHQGWEALRLGRPLFLMESLLKNSKLKWPKEMTKYGAQALSRESIDLLIESLPKDPVNAGLPF